MIVLAKVITGSDQVTLTARGVTILVELLQSDKNTTVVITGKLEILITAYTPISLNITTSERWSE